MNTLLASERSPPRQMNAGNDTETRCSFVLNVRGKGTANRHQYRQQHELKTFKTVSERYQGFSPSVPYAGHQAKLCLF